MAMRVKPRRRTVGRYPPTHILRRSSLSVDNIVCERELQQAGERLLAYVDTQPTE